MKNNNAGYTLIELLTVVTIIGILAAIAIPNYRGYRDKAKKVTVISTLRQIRLAQEVYWTDYGHYFPIDEPIVEAMSKITVIGLDMDIPISLNQKWSIKAEGDKDAVSKHYTVVIETHMDVNQNGIADQYTYSRTVDGSGNVTNETDISPLRPDANT
ncbi:MAG: hypothetical protein B6I37_07390 [Desulfobacteraceae bacterium 4572_35.2]|nr:MAG: hypothetical protein B6I37_07390 [Desulfobacteraceae bacterium 4572_35.2]